MRDASRELIRRGGGEATEKKAASLHYFASQRPRGMQYPHNAKYKWALFILLAARIHTIRYFNGTYIGSDCVKVEVYV